MSGPGDSGTPGGEWHRMSWEALAAAQQIGAAMGGRCCGGNRRSGPSEAATKKLAQVYAVEHELLTTTRLTVTRPPSKRCCRKSNPNLVLFPHTYQVRDFAPSWRRGLSGC